LMDENIGSVDGRRTLVADRPEYAWVDTKGVPAVVVILVFFFSLIISVVYVFSFTVLGAGVVLDSLLVSTNDTPLWSITFVWSVLVVVPVVMIVGILANVERRVGVGISGIRVQMWIARRDYTWESLAPWRRSPRGKWTTLCGKSRDPGWIGSLFGRSVPLTFYVCKDQARAILSYPNLNANIFPEAYWSWLGLSKSPIATPP
jgi:hypothetical protein